MYPKAAVCTHGSCSNCMRWALRWRRNVVGAERCDRHGRVCYGHVGGYCGGTPAVA